MQLSFFGGAKSVTGANFLLEANGHRFLIDCGLTQGKDFCDQCNFDAFAYDPKTINGVFLTHGHIDHCGRLPKLVKDGYNGPIYANEPTRDITELNLKDSAGLMEHEEQKRGIKALFGEEDVRRTMRQFDILGKQATIEPAPGVRVTTHDSGHILGSSMFLFEAEGKLVLFSGDLGNSPNPILPDLESIKDVDYVLMETVYGDRIHKRNDERRIADLRRAIEMIAASKGTLMIPAFAVERTQELLYELNDLVEHKKVPPMPYYVDSPLAIDMTRLFIKHQGFLNERFHEKLKYDSKLFEFPGLEFTQSREQSKAINAVEGPKVVVAGSGMSNGGRILHHERRYLQDPRSILLIVGFQADGSLGRQLVDGAKVVKIYDQSVPVHAKIMRIAGYSAHADQAKLAEWTGNFAGRVKRVFLAMGEERSAAAFGELIKRDQQIESHVPTLGETVKLV